MELPHIPYIVLAILLVAGLISLVIPKAVHEKKVTLEDIVVLGRMYDQINAQYDEFRKKNYHWASWGNMETLAPITQDRAARVTLDIEDTRLYRERSRLQDELRDLEEKYKEQELDKPVAYGYDNVSLGDVVPAFNNMQIGYKNIKRQVEK